MEDRYLYALSQIRKLSNEEVRKYIDPQFIPRCVTCGHLSDIPDDFGDFDNFSDFDDSEWGICDAWGLKDKRHKDTTCYRWKRNMRGT